MKFILFCFLLAVIIHADDPILTIAAAFYGDKDVTTDVIGKIEDNSLKIDAENSVFGDPWVGNVKTLSIYYFYGNSNLFLEVVREHQSILIKYFPQLHSGDFSNPPCPSILRAAYADKDVSIKAIEYAQTNGNVVPGSNSVFDDNMVGTVKAFSMVYLDQNCNQLSKVVRENEIINIGQ